jgi:hypothetical protein
MKMIWLVSQKCGELQQEANFIGFTVVQLELELLYFLLE